MKSAIIILAVVTGCVGAASSAAAQDIQTRTQAVRFSDLDLSRAAGRAMLERRLSHAAKWVCPDGWSRDLSTLHDVEKCRSRALAQAHARLNEIYDGRALARTSIEMGPAKR